jgi:hypothetical protein
MLRILTAVYLSSSEPVSIARLNLRGRTYSSDIKRKVAEGCAIAKALVLDEGVNTVLLNFIEVY